MAQERFLDPPMPDILAQWEHYLALLSPQPDDRVLDVGCNTGDADHLLLRRHPDVRDIVGLDRNQERLTRATEVWRSRGAPARLTFVRADASDLPFADASFDRLICAETLEWIRPPGPALAEMRRVLKPGGIALLVHTDFDTQVFAGIDLALTREIVHQFTDSGPDGTIGRNLLGLARQAGFRQVEPSVYPLVNTTFAPNHYAFQITAMMRDWLTQKGTISAEGLDEWTRGIEQAANEGRFFYSVNRNICVCYN